VYESVNGTDARQQAELLQKEWAAIGVHARINYNNFSELDEKLTKKKAQVWSIAWIADYPDAENFLQLLYGPNGSPGPNASNFNDPEYNKLYEKVRDMHDSPERRALIVKMRDIFIREMPWIPHRHRIYYYLRHDWLKNFKKEYMGSATAKFMRVDVERRAKGLD
jgi:oligopeptide transport system substrate-binding protein